MYQAVTGNHAIGNFALWKFNHEEISLWGNFGVMSFCRMCYIARTYSLLLIFSNKCKYKILKRLWNYIFYPHCITCFFIFWTSRLLVSQMLFCTHDLIQTRKHYRQCCGRLLTNFFLFWLILPGGWRWEGARWEAQEVNLKVDHSGVYSDVWHGYGDIRRHRLFAEPQTGGD